MAIKIFIDQGHNPTNPNSGAEGNGLYEQDITYEVGMLTAELLSNNENFEVRLSRNSPDEVLGTSNGSSLKARTDAANAWGADLFISIHANASTITEASGSEAFAYSQSSVGYAVGEDILYWLSLETGLQNRGMKVRPSLWVLRKTRMPAVLLELGFITNPEDARLMSEEPEAFAEGIYNGILEYYGFISRDR